MNSFSDNDAKNYFKRMFGTNENVYNDSWDINLQDNNEVIDLSNKAIKNVFENFERMDSSLNIKNKSKLVKLLEITIVKKFKFMIIIVVKNLIKLIQ